MKRAPSRGLSPSAPVVLNWQMGERCYLMKSARFRPPFKPSCCVSCRKANWSGRRQATGRRSPHCATNKHLETPVIKGEFRADLYYRINVVPIKLPPLRERPGDIPRLANAFLDRFNKENNRALAFAPSALDLISQCYFPGNVRELENCVQRTATLARSRTITPSDFACKKSQCLSWLLWKRPDRSNGGNPIDDLARVNAVPVGLRLPASCIGASAGKASPLTAGDPNDPACPPRLTERDRLIDALDKAGWVQARAARILGLTPRQVGYALRRHGIEVKKF
jgi:Nif-specific regulatory protein